MAPKPSGLPPGSWSGSDVTFLIKSSIRKGVGDEEEVHGGPDRFCVEASGEQDAGRGDHPKNGDLGSHVISLEEEVSGDGGRCPN